MSGVVRKCLKWTDKQPPEQPPKCEQDNTSLCFRVYVEDIKLYYLQIEPRTSARGFCQICAFHVSHSARLPIVATDGFDRDTKNLAAPVSAAKNKIHALTSARFSM